MVDKTKIRAQTAIRVQRNRDKATAHGYQRREFSLSDSEYEAVVAFISQLRDKGSG